MSAVPCTISSDCTSEDGVLKFCFEEASFSNETFFCDCPVDFGWTGENCDQPSGVQAFYKLCTFIIFFWSFILLILSTRTVLLNIGLQYNPKQGVDPIVYTGVFVLLGTICVFISSIMNIPPFFNPRHFEIVVYRSIEDVETVDVKHGYFINILTLFTATFVSFSALFMILSLDNIISKISRFQPTLENKTSSLKNRIFLIVFSILILSFIILSATGFVFLGSYLIIFFTVFILVYFIYSVINFVKVMKTLSATENEIVRKTTQLVKNTYLQASIALGVIFIGTIAYSTTLINLDSNIAPGDFNHVFLLRTITELGGLYLLTVIAWYVNSVTEGVIMADDWHMLCCVFKYWDSKNKQLMPNETDILETQHSSRKESSAKPTALSF